MDIATIFGLQFSLSLLSWGLVLSFLVFPWLARKSRREALLWLSVPHMFRHIGMVFLVPGLVAEPLPAGFAGPAAYGDLATGLLAVVAVVALHRRMVIGIPLVWLFNVVGAVDLLNALRHVDVAPAMGAAWYIPTMFVPLLLLTHYQMFRRLTARTTEAEEGAAEHGPSALDGVEQSARLRGARDSPAV